MPDTMISAFEIIGPSIIGPSSSHTAGAARLALWAKRIAAEAIKEVTFVLQVLSQIPTKGMGRIGLYWQASLAMRWMIQQSVMPMN